MFRQAVHGSGCVEKNDVESERDFKDRSNTAYLMSNQCLGLPDSELFGLDIENKSDDSNYTHRDAASQIRIVRTSFHLCVTSATKFSKQ